MERLLQQQQTFFADLTMQLSSRLNNSSSSASAKDPALNAILSSKLVDYGKELKPSESERFTDISVYSLSENDFERLIGNMQGYMESRATVEIDGLRNHGSKQLEKALFLKKLIKQQHCLAF